VREATRGSVWPLEASSAELETSIDTLVIDLRQPRDVNEALPGLRELARWCVSELAVRTSDPQPLAIIVRHQRSGSGRTSDSLWGEVALNAVRGFFRQLRYDRNWLSTPLSFVDAGEASDEEVRALVDALGSGSSRIEVDKSSGITVAATWKHKEGL
jgi:hypothetical protein